MDVKTFANKLFEGGKGLGFTDMEIYYVNSENFEVTAFEKNIDSYNVNTEIGLSFRGIINGKMGYSYTEKFDDEDVDFILRSAAQNAKETQTDVEVSIFEGSNEYRALSNNELKDEDVSVKIKDALGMEETALKSDSRIKSVQYCLVTTTKGKRRIMNTKGLDLEEASGLAVAYISVVAEDGSDVKSGGKFRLSSDYGKIKFDDLVEEASKEAISKLGAKSIESGKYKIILRHDAAASLLATFSSIFSADAAQKGLSLLKDKVGSKIASEVVSMVDNPYYEDSPSSCSFDDEGVATMEKDIIRDGMLKTLLHNIKTAKKDGVKSTGNGFKPSYKSPVAVVPTNMYIAPGSKSFDDAIKSMDKAIIITDLQGLHSGANAVSGDFSLAAAGFLIENGRISRPIEQITVADNFYSVLSKVEEVLADFQFNIPTGASFGSPSLVINEMAISGK